jgi:hypothetical protein
LGSWQHLSMEHHL